MTDSTYENQRKRLLTRRSADLGLHRAPGRPVWGVVMEIGAPDGVTSIVATDDGAATLLTSAGDSIHLTESDWPYSAGTRLVGSACDFVFECSPAWAHPLPENGMIRFYLLTFDGVMTVEAPLRELASDDHPLSNLYYAGHDVYFIARFVSENPNWRSHKPAVAQVAATAETQTAAPAETQTAAPAGAEAPERADADSTSSAGVSSEAASGSDLLLQAVTRNDVDEVALLLAQGHDFGPNDVGLTPLMAAAHHGALEPLRLLLAAAAPVDIQETHGYTALMLACNAGHDVCVRLLLGAGADVHARDDEGFTSLMFAAKNGHEGIVKILMERGADPTTTNDRGLSAVNLAEQKGHTETVSILRGK